MDIFLVLVSWLLNSYFSERLSFRSPIGRGMLGRCFVVIQVHQVAAESPALLSAHLLIQSYELR